MIIAIVLGLAIFATHYGYASFTDGSRQSHIDVYYAATGFEAVLLYLVLALLCLQYRRSKAVYAALAMCAWGFVESGMKGGCQTVALLIDRYPEVNPAQGLCSALIGIDIASITAVLFLTFVAWAVYAKPRDN